MKKKIKAQSGALVISAFAACVLVACGGGGSGGGSASTPTSQPPVATTNTTASTITTATVTPNYTAEELAAYNAVSTARTTCGFGGVNQNASLDAATLNHNDYSTRNYQFGHFETAGLAGYTGNQPYQRGVAAGYTPSFIHYGEVLAYASNIPKAGFGLLGTRRLLGAPYHLTGLMGVDRELGINVRSAGPAGTGADFTTTNPSWAPSVYLGIDLASQPSMPSQHQSGTDVLTYPCSGVTGTIYQLTAETPNPVPSRNLLTTPIGQPIFVQVLAGNALVITGASVSGPSGSVALLPTMTSANDPNSELLTNQAMIMPSGPLSPSTTYTVSITGTNNGTQFSRNFTFTTGSTS